MVNIGLLRDLQRDWAEDLCRHFFPNGKKVGNEWKIADTTGASGNSLAIHLTGDKAGLWIDRATDEGGGFVKLLSANRNLTLIQAVEEIERVLGVSLRSDSFLGVRLQQSPGVSRAHKAVIAPWTGLPYHMSPEESRRAYQAARALNGTAEQIEQIADWRGLRPEIIRSLILDWPSGSRVLI
jgi:hypothetical protein